MSAGLYIHIPFCRKACHYCNFHFSTSLQLKKALLDALRAEISLQCDYLGGASLGSVYFGGGTPSLLTAAEISQILQTVQQYHYIEPEAEITLEANPDDLTPEWLRQLRDTTPVNRLSIGIQSFSDEDLRWMNRAHSAAEARRSIEIALEQGYSNLTADLIYGSPTTSDDQWAANIDLLLSYNIPHLSCYCLTVETGTALHHFVQKGEASPPDDDRAVRQFDYLMGVMREQGYDHYEISNFARPSCYAVHNSLYWKGEPYLGIGPSAHSYDGISRQWNIAHNPKYIASLQQGTIPFEKEVLTPIQRYNEYVMTSLRTAWGCDTAGLDAIGEGFKAYFEKKILPHVHSGSVVQKEGNYRLSDQGKFLADAITVSLFWEE